MSIKIINPSSTTTSSSGGAINIAFNPNFEVFQRGNSIIIPASSNAYSGDRWLIQNTSDATVNTTKVSGVANSNSFNGLGATMGSGGTTGRFAVWQILDSFSSYLFYGASGSISFQVWGQGNVNQIGIQFYENTSAEALPSTAIGSEQLFTVNSGGPTLCAVNGVSFGTGLSSAGCYGVRIRPTAVSSGNLYDAANGLLMANAMWTQSSTAQSFYYNDSQVEIAKCQRFYQKTYDIDTAPATVTFNGAIVNDAQPADNPVFCGQLKVSMRVAPTVVYYNPGTGGTGSVRGIGSSANVTINALTSGQNTIAANTNTIITSDAYAVHYTADAEIT